MRLILAGLDGSKRAPAVLRTAVSLARKTGARLLLLRAVGIPVPMPPEAYSVSPTELPDLLERDAMKYLEGIAADVPPELLAGLRVKLSNPWHAICDLARDENVNLIVVGSHGYDVVDRVLGTTAAKVVNHADQSVLVVRGSDLLGP